MANPAGEYIPISNRGALTRETPRLAAYKDCDDLFAAKSDDELEAFADRFFLLWGEDDGGDVASLRALRDAMQTAARLKYALENSPDLGREGLERIGFTFSELRVSARRGHLGLLGERGTEVVPCTECYAPSLSITLGDGSYRKYMERVCEHARCPDYYKQEKANADLMLFYSFKPFCIEGDSLTLRFGFIRQFAPQEVEELLKLAYRSIIEIHLSEVRLMFGNDDVLYPYIDCAATGLWYALAHQLAGRELGICKREGCNTVFVRSKPRNPAKARQFCCDYCKRAYYAEKKKKADDGKR